MRILFLLLMILVSVAPAHALGIADLSNADAVAGLKDALAQGAAAAVGQLGVENGFLWE